MRRLSPIIVLLALSLSLMAQKSPHGDSFRANCDDCHKTNSWKVDLNGIDFDHKTTNFPLVGQHQVVSCKDCHTSLEFAKAQTECNSCHTDIHEQTVGNECARCHTPNSWVVTNITQIHQQSRFPLLGPHTVADCRECHKNLLSSSSPATPTASLLRFDPIGVECYDCHKQDYTAAKEPDHIASNYSTNCTECHNINSFSWNGAGINHNFFPLEGGHDISDCKTCHTSGSYSKIPAECVTCHQPDYNSAVNPNHKALNFSTECNDCHSLSPGWKPAEYRDHDSRSFPIYSGEHSGEWESCSDCHKNPANYGEFTCTDCHEHNKSDMDDEHGGVSGYEYNSIACFACHPTGSGEGSFDHNKSGFPLTGAHTTTSCTDCHTSGYAGTSNVCASCHTNSYNQTVNPNHTAAGISNDCASCHTTNPGWKPATYPAHSNLEGAHVPIANDCAACHNGNYSTLPKLCNDCHSTDYTQANNPSHTAAQFPVTCAECHTQSAWTPATFNHDGQYFPIYSGKHNGEWDNCSDCHTNPADYKVYTCTSSCHPKPEMDSEHQGVGGYLYNSPACLECHPQGDAEGAFNHNISFPLTGGHANADCASCHANGYTNTPNTCISCHTPDFNQSANPNHTTLGISNDCAACHTTNPGWSPATFPTHNNYYVIAGAHVPVANDCAACHNGNYINSPNTCMGCHTTNYNQTANPNHVSAQFPTTCEDCHTQTAWTPSTFNHDGQYFPIYSGKHNGEWNACADCHTNPSNYAVFTCTTSCHPQSSTNNEHQGVGGYQYLSSACLACHPNGNSAGAFNHNTSPFPLTGGHAGADCASCHANGYNGTSTACESCHTPEYTQSANPNHVAIGISNDCAACHTTNPDWQPATFPVHNNYYVLAGAHVPISNQCADCHNGNYNNTPNTCSGCHMDNYNQTSNPNHVTSGFSTECATCHTQTAWIPSTFDHNNTYPLTGAHASIASNCVQCHPNGYSNTPNTCAGCHQNNYNQATNPNHVALGLSNDCAVCHTTNPDWQPATFPVHNNYYVLSGAHVSADCSDCHNGNYNNTPNVCSGCHMSDYNQTTDPNHASAQFPTTCEDCHTSTAWEPSTFDHDGQYFPIYSGQHNGEWNTCSECHPNSTNYAVFTCTTSCHPQSSTNNDHNGVSGYQYLSSACLNCHPDGNGDKKMNINDIRND